MAVELREQALAPLAEARVDRSVGIISGVVIHTSHSRNGRRYTRKALQDVARLANGAQMFVDHPTRSEMRARKGVRSVEGLAGKVTNTRVTDDGKVLGDLQILNKEPTRSLVFSLAENPELAGLSIRARGEVERGADDATVVKSVSEVQSVDLVSEPASTSSLFESVQDQLEEQQERRLQERAEAACRSVGMEKALVESLGTIHHEIVGAPEDPRECQKRAKELMECRRKFQARTKSMRRPRHQGPKLHERDPDEVLNDDRTRENGSGWALPDDVLDELFGPGAF